MSRVSSKIALAVMTVTGLVLVVDASLMAERSLQQHDDDLRHDHLVTAGIVARVLGSVVSSSGHDPHRIEEVVNLVRSEHPHLSIRWVPDHPIEHVRQFVDGADLRTRVPVGEGAGYVEIVESRGDRARYHRDNLARALALAVLLLSLSAAVIHLASRFIIRGPFMALLARLHELKEGHLEGAIALRRRDEFGLIAEAVDELSEQLQEALERRAAAEAERESARRQLEHANRLATLGRLAAGVAHELGTPMNVILARAKRIERAGPPGAEQVAGAAQITRQVNRMTAILRQLMAYARPQRPRLARTDVGELTRSAVGMMQPLGGMSDVSLDVRVTGDPTAEVDAAQIEQVMVNLLQNAIQAIGEHGRVDVSIEGDDDTLLLCVDDSGEGVDEALIPTLFEPFVTTKEVGQGTGLGLSVVQGIVRSHRGTIEVGTSPLGGARFSVSLPRRRPPEPSKA